MMNLTLRESKKIFFIISLMVISASSAFAQDNYVGIGVNGNDNSDKAILEIKADAGTNKRGVILPTVNNTDIKSIPVVDGLLLLSNGTIVIGDKNGNWNQISGKLAVDQGDNITLGLTMEGSSDIVKIKGLNREGKLKVEELTLPLGDNYKRQNLVLTTDENGIPKWIEQATFLGTTNRKRNSSVQYNTVIESQENRIKELENELKIIKEKLGL